MLEVKCPYSHCEDSIEDAVAGDGQFCLIKQADSYHLNQSHAYHQVQTQFFVYNVPYCNFCLLTFDSSSKELTVCTFSVYIEQNESFWDKFVIKLLVARNCTTLVYKVSCVIIQ